MAESVKIMVRCPPYVLELIDKVCELTGFSRAELMRTGTINYCQSLLATDALKSVCEVAFKLNSQVNEGQTKFTDEQLTQLKQLNEMTAALNKSLGME